MAHFAKVEDGIIQEVIVVSDDDCGDSYPDSEKVGQDFIATLGLSGEWRQTSYNNNFRNKYAGIGYSYQDYMFISPKPFDSWLLVEGEWISPSVKPEGMFRWDEGSLSWKDKLC